LRTAAASDGSSQRTQSIKRGQCLIRLRGGKREDDPFKRDEGCPMQGDTTGTTARNGDDDIRKPCERRAHSLCQEDGLQPQAFGKRKDGRHFPVEAPIGQDDQRIAFPKIKQLGGLLLLFGLRWLRKAILRAAGVLPLHDEALAFQKEQMRLAGVARAAAWDNIAFAASFQITMLEGAEVVFIVLGFGAGDVELLRAGSLGALAALLLVIIVGAAVHRPLARVPENQLKFLVGLLLSAFGTFWFGEGVGLAWPGADLSLATLVAGYLAVALIAVRACLARQAYVRMFK
jgi:uncharacterized membrane protein